MADEMNNTPPVEGMEQDYLEQIQQLKNSTVSREAYDKMRDENKKLLETIINGGQMEAPAENTNIDYNKLLHETIFEKKSDNLGYVEAFVTAYEAAAKEGIKYAMPFGPKAEYGEMDEETCDFTAKKLREIIDKANGSEKAFNFLLDQEMVDNMPARGPGRKNFR